MPRHLHHHLPLLLLLVVEGSQEGLIISVRTKNLLGIAAVCILALLPAEYCTATGAQQAVPEDPSGRDSACPLVLVIKKALRA
jgi:hypothetical protein